MMFGRNTGSDLIVPLIPRGSAGIEIGVWRGESSTKFLTRASFLYMVDPWSVEAYADSDEFGGFEKFLQRYRKLTGKADSAAFQDYYDAIYESVCKRFRSQPVKICRMTSQRFWAGFHETVDWVYIDGSHEYQRCLADLEASRKVVKKGGFIFGDDYGNKPGVTAAVEDFGLPFEALGKNQYAIPL